MGLGVGGKEEKEEEGRKEQRVAWGNLHLGFMMGVSMLHGDLKMLT